MSSVVLNSVKVTNVGNSNKTVSFKVELINCYELLFYGSSSTKIRPQAKIDNFAFKNSNIIIEDPF